MLKFGKKVNYRPFLVSGAIATAVGLIFGINIATMLGVKIAIILFLLMFLGHYLLVLPVIFNYWDSDSKFIRYNDIKPFNKRLLAILLPKFSPVTVIDRKNIQQISILGLPQHDLSFASELVLSEEGGLMYNLFLMINEPVKVRLTMKNREIIDLDLSRDYVRRPHETLGKLRIFLKGFNPRILELSDETEDLLQLRQKEEDRDDINSP